ncbi:hypothetical protein [Thiomicrorhabdus indica]|uniref:hypothetical protein n=1 Tax=Thiomicrorhabdus indica TaxID=2267253 RepID=UPI00102DFA17|nr:hypothetical protein [Thiomicrorhabdus indica]
MLDDIGFTFFSRPVADKFVAFCEQIKVRARIQFEETFSGESAYQVELLNTIDEALLEQLEECYSELLFGEEAANIEGNDEQGALADACGVQVQLQSGQFTTVAIEPEIMNKILSVLSIDELQSFLAQVAEDIENPKSGPICSRKPDNTI